MIWPSSLTFPGASRNIEISAHPPRLVTFNALPLSNSEKEPTDPVTDVGLLTHLNGEPANEAEKNNFSELGLDWPPWSDLGPLVQPDQSAGNFTVMFPETTVRIAGGW